MRKLKIAEHISLDGIIQHTADENGFPYVDWTAPYRTPEGRDALLAAYGEKYDMLLGRRTYDLWTGFWPKASGPMADRINAATKFIVTHHPETLAWGPSQGVGPDLIEGVRKLKAQDGPDLILCGSTSLTSTLLEHGLADELLLVVYPILIGTGKRLFAEGSAARTFELASTASTPTGLFINQYKLSRPLATA